MCHKIVAQYVKDINASVKNFKNKLAEKNANYTNNEKDCDYCYHCYYYNIDDYHSRRFNTFKIDLD